MAGDIFDKINPQSWVIGIFSKLMRYAKKKKVEVWIIPGNHDCGVEHHSLEYLPTLLENVHVILEPGLEYIDGMSVAFLPHIVREKLEKVKVKYGSYQEYALHEIDQSVDVLIGHAHITGAKNASDIEIEAGEALEFDPSNFFKFKWGVFGHIHKYQTLKKGKIIYTGAVVTNSFDEAELIKGFVHISDPSDCEFIPFITEDTEYKQVVIDLISKQSFDESKIKALAKNKLLKLTVYAKSLMQIDESYLRKLFNEYGEVVRFESIIANEIGEITAEDVSEVFSQVNYIPVLRSWLDDQNLTEAGMKMANRKGKEIIEEVLHAERD